MGARLLPADFDLTVLPASERGVLTTLLDSLSDEWTLVPRVAVAGRGRDHEIDLVAISSTRGVLLLEVKGGAITMERGAFRQNGFPIADPMLQAKDAMYALVRRMQAMGVSLRGLWMRSVVCFPDVVDVPDDGYGPGCPRADVIAHDELQWADKAIDAIAGTARDPVEPAAMERFVRALCPDIPMGAAANDYFASSVQQMHHATKDMLLVAKGADVNRRVWLSGGPGSGKTAVVRAWAEQAVRRGERVAVMCFNKPVSSWLVDKHGSAAAHVGTFHDLLVKLAQPLGLVIPDPASREFWRDELPAFVRAHVGQIPTRFDTIIVDEGQDFLPEWLALLQELLAHDGPRRFLLCADPGQCVYVDDWRAPDDMMRLHLPINLRNARRIAAFARRFGGGEPYMHNHPGAKVTFHVAGGQREIRRRLQECLHEMMHVHHVPPAKILVLGLHRDVANTLLDLELGDVDNKPLRLVRWDERSEDAVVCESVRRAKGLEATAVFLVCPDDKPDPRLLGIGATRARLRLGIIGPRTLGDELALTPEAPSATVERTG